MGTTGRVEAKLTAFGRIEGWVFGYVGEASPDVHRFVDVVSKRGAQKRWRAMGAASVQDARKVIKARVICRLGIEAAPARSHGRLILGRLAVMRTEVRAALRRRRATRDTWKRDRWNYYMRGGPRAYVPNNREGRRFA